MKRWSLKEVSFTYCSEEKRDKLILERRGLVEGSMTDTLRKPFFRCLLAFLLGWGLGWVATLSTSSPVVRLIPLLLLLLAPLSSLRTQRSCTDDCPPSALGVRRVESEELLLLLSSALFVCIMSMNLRCQDVRHTDGIKVQDGNIIQISEI